MELATSSRPSGYSDFSTHFLKWAFPADPRRLTWCHLGAVTFFFFAAATLGLLLRTELLVSDSFLLSEDIYGRLFSLHGMLMIFFFALPAIPLVLGHIALPKSLRDGRMAFPAMGVIGFYLYLFGGLILLAGTVAGGHASTWVLTAPGADSSPAVGLWTLAGLTLLAAGLVVHALNFAVSLLGRRRPDLSWMQMPVFSWSLLLWAIVLTVTLPVLMAIFFLLGIQLVTAAGPFPVSSEGDPLLFQRLFWFAFRPILYAMILPALGIVTEIFERDSSGGLSRRVVHLSLLSLPVLGAFGGGSHLVAGDAALATLISSFFNIATVAPASLLLLHWLLRLAGRRSGIDAPVLFSLGAVLLLVSGGLTGIVLAPTAENLNLHGTAFVVAHFHMLLAGSLVMAYLAGIHEKWRRLAADPYGRTPAWMASILIFLGVNATFLPHFLLGTLGLPRRLPVYPGEFEALQVLSWAGATILLVGYLLPLAYLLWSLVRGGGSRLSWGQEGRSSFSAG